MCNAKNVACGSCPWGHFSASNIQQGTHIFFQIHLIPGNHSNMCMIFKMWGLHFVEYILSKYYILDKQTNNADWKLQTITVRTAAAARVVIIVQCLDTTSHHCTSVDRIHKRLFLFQLKQYCAAYSLHRTCNLQATQVLVALKCCFYFPD